MKQDCQYNARLKRELEYYREVNNVHQLPQIFHYFSNKFTLPKLQSFGFNSLNDFYTHYVKKAMQKRDSRTQIASIGSGNCELEVLLAETLLKGECDFNICCLELNPDMLERGLELAKSKCLYSRFVFNQVDINHWKADKKYDVIIASHSLHHVVELENLFEEIHGSLAHEGFFLVHDMVGRNGHMRWPEALGYVQAFWSLLEDRHKYNQQLKRHEGTFEDWDTSKESFEGIRSQDILPLLIKRFDFEMFLGFNNLIDVFVDRSFGHNFDKDNPKDRYFIDFVAGLDDYFINTGMIKPTQIIAALKKDEVCETRTYKHLTPEFSVRRTE